MTQSKTSLGGLFAFGNKGPPSRRLSWALEGGLRCMSPCRLDLLCAGPAGWSGRTKSIVLNLAISEAPSVGAGDTTATLEQSPERETTAGKQVEFLGILRSLFRGKVRDSFLEVSLQRQRG